MTSTIHSLAVARGASPASSTASAASASPAAPRFALGLPPRPALLSRRAWLALVALCIAVGVGCRSPRSSRPKRARFICHPTQ